MLTLDNEEITHFNDRNEFSIYIETYAISTGSGLITSLLQYCEDADVDVKDCSKLISDSLKEKIESEAIEDKLMTRKSASLSFFD